ncbi:MAG: hypothetical protein ACTSVU_03680 [Promethearchaeota archaeon]
MGKKCMNCNGTGRCPFCHGTGMRNYRGIGTTSKRKCDICHGTGVCRVCRGKGEI